MRIVWILAVAIGLAGCAGSGSNGNGGSSGGSGSGGAPSGGLAITCAAIDDPTACGSAPLQTMAVDPLPGALLIDGGTVPVETLSSFYFNLENGEGPAGDDFIYALGIDDPLCSGVPSATGWTWWQLGEATFGGFPTMENFNIYAGCPGATAGTFHVWIIISIGTMEDPVWDAWLTPLLVDLLPPNDPGIAAFIEHSAVITFTRAEAP